MLPCSVLSCSHISGAQTPAWRWGKRTMQPMLSLQQAEFSGFEVRLRPVAHPQLAQDVAEVVLDGATGDVEGLADLAIGSPTRQQGQDLPLALGQLRHLAPADERRGGRSSH